MLYRDIKRVKQGPLHNHLMLYRIDGKSRIFASVKRYLLKELRQFIISKKDSIKSIEVPKESAENLCPSCYVPLQNGLSQCPYCKAHLKEPKKALFRSLVLPGWGDLYLGRKALGILELMGSVIVWVFVTSLLLEGREGNLVLALFLLLFYNGQDGLFTHQVGKKGYMLAGD